MRERFLIGTTAMAVFLAGLAGFGAAASAQDDPTPSTETADTPPPDGAVDGDVADAPPPTRMQVFIRKMKTTGTTGIALVAVSVFGLACVLERLFRLNRGVFLTPGLAGKADDLWRAGQFDELLARCRSDRSALSEVIATIVRHRNVPANDVEVLAGDVGARAIRRQQQKAYPLAVVAGLAPLLGLLGTVIGMVGAFEKVAAVGSMGDASILADDISKALLTTAWGLTIAIPALVAYHYFKSRTNNFGLLLEEQAAELMSRWIHLSRAGRAPDLAATEGGPQP